VNDTDHVRLFEDARWSRGEQTPVWRHRVAAEMVRETPVLDVGGGDGLLLKMLRDRGLQGLHLVDLSPVAVANARQAGFDADEGDVSARLPLEDGAFATVCALDVLEHLREPVGPLREIARVGGEVIVAVPNFQHLRGRLAMLDWARSVPESTATGSRLLDQPAGALRRDRRGRAPREGMEIRAVGPARRRRARPREPVALRLRGVVRRPPGTGVIAVRILHVQKVKGIGGSERHLLSLLPGLAARGDTVAMVVLVPGPEARPFLDACRAANVETIQVPIGFDADPRPVRGIASAIRRFAPDVVHTHLVHADLWGQAAARRRSVPAVRTVHNVQAFSRKEPVRSAVRLSGRLARRTIAISEHVAGICAAGRSPRAVAWW
jgi:SAM-dependent methyltransferase